MTYEDFTTFTEVDVGADRIQKTANHIDHYACLNETTYLYKDYGAAHFSDFTHKIKAKHVTATAHMSEGVFWMLSNDLGNAKALADANKSFIYITFYRQINDIQIRLREVYNGALYTDTYTTDSGTNWRYVKLEKSGTDLKAYIYSDSGYSTLLDTLTLTLHVDGSYKYLFGCNTYASGLTDKCLTSDIENFDIGGSSEITKTSSIGLTINTEPTKTSSIGLNVKIEEIKTSSIGLTAMSRKTKTSSLGLTILNINSKVSSVGLHIQGDPSPYSYYKVCSVNSTTAGPQTNYQMVFIVGESSGSSGVDTHCNNHCVDFPNDIRFLEADNITPHDYWMDISSIEGVSPNRKVNAIIEVTSIPASGSVDLYMHYGKSGDTGESDGEDTFPFFDHFDDQTKMAQYDSTPSGDVDAHQGVATDGSYFYVTTSGTLYKYNLSWGLVNSRNVSSDGPAEQTQINHVFYKDNKLYCGANNYNNDPAKAWMMIYNTSDLSFVEYHYLGTNLGDGEGCAYHDGYWWCVGGGTSKIEKYNESWGYVAAYDIDFSCGGASRYCVGCQGIIWIGDNVWVTKHEGCGDYNYGIFHWNGTGFELIIKKAPPTIRCTQGLGPDPNGSVVWWAERFHNGDPDDRRVVKSNIILDEYLNLQKWGEAGTPSLANSECALNGNDRILGKTSFGYGYEVRAKAKANEQDIWFVGWADTNDAEPPNGVWVANSDYTHPDDFDMIRCECRINGGWGSHPDYDNNYDFRNTYYEYYLQRISSAINYCQHDTLIWTRTTDLPTGNLAPHLRVWNSSQESTLTIDWVFVRKYVSPEPTWGTCGSEQSPSQTKTSSIGVSIISETTKTSSIGLSVQIEGVEKTSSMGLSVQLEGVEKASSIGLCIETEKTKPSSLGLTIQIEKTKPSSMGVSIQSEKTKQSSLGVSIQTEKTKQSTICLSIGIQETKQSNIGMCIKEEKTKQSLIGLTIEAQETKTSTVGLQIASPGNVVSYIGLSIQTEKTKQSSVGLYIIAKRTKQSTIGLRIIARKIQPTTVGLTVQISKAKESHVGLSIESQITKQSSVGIGIQTQKTKLSTVGLSVTAPKTKQSTTGLEVVARKTKQSTIGVRIVTQIAKPSTLGLQIVNQTTKTSNVGLSIQIELIKTSTIGLTIQVERIKTSTLGLTVQAHETKVSSAGLTVAPSSKKVSSIGLGIIVPGDDKGIIEDGKHFFTRVSEEGRTVFDVLFLEDSRIILRIVATKQSSIGLLVTERKTKASSVGLQIVVPRTKASSVGARIIVHNTKGSSVGLRVVANTPKPSSIGLNVQIKPTKQSTAGLRIVVQKTRQSSMGLNIVTPKIHESSTTLSIIGPEINQSVIGMDVAVLGVQKHSSIGLRTIDRKIKTSSITLEVAIYERESSIGLAIPDENTRESSIGMYVFGSNTKQSSIGLTPVVPVLEKGMFYTKIGDIILDGPIVENFRVSKEMNRVPTFEVEIANTAGNRTAISNHIDSDLKIYWYHKNTSTLLLTGIINADGIEYISLDSIQLTGFASYVKLSWPFHKFLSSEDKEPVDKAIVYNGYSTYTDFTTEINNDTANDVLLNFGGVNRMFFIGSAQPFYGAQIKYSTKGIKLAGCTISLQFSKSDGSWSPLQAFDESNGFTENPGTYDLIIPHPPSDWGKGNVNGVMKYWIAWKITGGSYSVNPKLDRGHIVNVDVLRTYYFNTSARGILLNVLSGTEYTMDPTDACPEDEISIIADYESKLRIIAAIPNALTWTDTDGSKKQYQWWIDDNKKVHMKKKRGVIRPEDITGDTTIFNNHEDYFHLSNRLYGFGPRDGLSQIRAIVEDRASIAEHRLREIAVAKDQIADYTMLHNSLEKDIAISKAPMQRIKGSVTTEFWITNNFELGDTVTLHQDAWNVPEMQMQIVKVEIGPLNTTLNLGISQEHLEGLKDNMQRRLDLNNIQMHGSTTLLEAGPETMNYHRISDTEVYPAKLEIEIPSNVKKVHKVQLSWTICPYRADVAESGGEVPAHSHEGWAGAGGAIDSDWAGAGGDFTPDVMLDGDFYPDMHTSAHQHKVEGTVSIIYDTVEGYLPTVQYATCASHTHTIPSTDGPDDTATALTSVTWGASCTGGGWCIADLFNNTFALGSHWHPNTGKITGGSGAAICGFATLAWSTYVTGLQSSPFCSWTSDAEDPAHLHVGIYEPDHDHAGVYHDTHNDHIIPAVIAHSDHVIVAEPGTTITTVYGIHEEPPGTTLELLVNGEKVGEYATEQTEIRIDGYMTTGNNTVALQPIIGENKKGGAKISAVGLLFVEPIKF